VTSDPNFKVTTFFEVKYRKDRQSYYYKEEMYLTYGMVLWTLTDL